MTAGVYLHIPFCKSRCSYCDFATDVYKHAQGVERYVEALCAEINASATGDSAASNSEIGAENNLKIIDSIYFGGGTPSLLAPEQVERILGSVSDTFDVLPKAEITMEMNPATVTSESLLGYKSLGINRASFGVQTFDDRALKLLGRGHNSADARATFAMLRKAGFENVSLDLIAGLPGQTLDDWKINLEEALVLSPEHLSLYLLEIHQGTPLAAQVSSGRQPDPDPELAAEMYEVMLERLATAGYEQYEISNFSRAGFESRHNTKYWRLDPVYGFGVSAHSFAGDQRFSNERDTAKYVERIENFGTAEVFRENIDAASEFVFLGLRLENGVDLAEYRKRFDIDLVDKHAVDLDALRNAGLIEIDGQRLKLTQIGKLFSNEVFAVFV